MSLDRLIDPVTGDVQLAGGGGYVLDDAVANMIILSYSIDLGSWEGDPTAGHRFKELERELDTIETRQRVADFARGAVQWLVDAGLLSSVDVVVESYAPGVVAFQSLCYRPGEPRPLAGVGVQFVSVGGT